MAVLIPALTSFLAALRAAGLLAQWRDRRGTFQAVCSWAWRASRWPRAARRSRVAWGWDETRPDLYLTGAVWTAGWLGLGNAFLLGRTRFGYAFALCLLLAGLFTFLTPRRFPSEYPRSGHRAPVYLIVALTLAFAIAAATWLGTGAGPVSPRWGSAARRCCRCCSWCPPRSRLQASPSIRRRVRRRARCCPGSCGC